MCTFQPVVAKGLTCLSFCCSFLFFALQLLKYCNADCHVIDLERHLIGLERHVTDLEHREVDASVLQQAPPVLALPHQVLQAPEQRALLGNGEVGGHVGAVSGGQDDARQPPRAEHGATGPRLRQRTGSCRPKQKQSKTKTLP